MGEPLEKVLVTGGAGYIGSVLVGELLQEGFGVTVVDNFLYRQNSLAAHCHQRNLSVAVADVRHSNELAHLVKSHDIVIPLAAIVGAPACNERAFDASSTNLDATLNLLRGLSNDQFVIMPTTNSAYGSGPIGQVFTEESDLNPISSYAREKVIVEEALMQHPMSISLRLATVFGMSPRMRLDLLVNNFVLKALRDEYLLLFEDHFTRNFIHVKDVAHAFILAIKNRESMLGNIYNVGLSTANLTKMELAQTIQRQLPNLTIVRSDHRSDPDQRNYLVSNEKIENAGFVPKFSLEDGVAELIKGIRTLSQGNYFNTF